jgi:hypothetical protein
MRLYGTIGLVWFDIDQHQGFTIRTGTSKTTRRPAQRSGAAPPDFPRVIHEALGVLPGPTKAADNCFCFESDNRHPYQLIGQYPS